MLTASCDTTPQPFWQQLALAVLSASAVPLAHHAGKAVREAIEAKRRKNEGGQ